MELDKIDTPPNSPRDYRGTFVQYLQDNGFTRDVAQKVSDKLGLQNIPYCVCVRGDEIEELGLAKQEKWKIREIVALMRSAAKRASVIKYFDERYDESIETFLENNGIERNIADLWVGYSDMDLAKDLNGTTKNDVYNWNDVDSNTKNKMWRLVQMIRYIGKDNRDSKVADWLVREEKKRRLNLLLAQLRQFY
jgi:rRNA-processing protein FCF1